MVVEAGMTEVLLVRPEDVLATEDMVMWYCISIEVGKVRGIHSYSR